VYHSAALDDSINDSEKELLRVELNRQLEKNAALAEDLAQYRGFVQTVADLARELGLENVRYDPRSVDRPTISSPDEEIPPARKFDVVCFSIIDWEFRWQRPQQIMSEFARRGHRVFFISISRYLPPGGERCAVRKLRDNVWEVQLAVPDRIDVYGAELTRELVHLLLDDLRALRNTFDVVAAVSFVQLATWSALAYAARAEFGWRVVYDCMDEWDTFPGMSQELLAAERRLLRDADLLVVTGAKLFEKYSHLNPNTVLARNAADFDRFQAPDVQPVLEDVPRPIVGYFGAIADWFDLELVVRLARERPNYSIVLLGGVFDVPVRDLQGLPNVHLLGQQPYELMPAYLRKFDVCMIPFRINPITEATDPVKFYEYVSQGKPVVATRMHELETYSELLYIAADHDDFIRKVDAAVRENDPAIHERRVALARSNTWQARVMAIEGGIRRAHPLVSIVVVTFHNVEVTRQCLESVFERTLYPNFEVIVVDNASTDGTREYLDELQGQHENFTVILNDDNRGFAAANNQGLARATGEILVLLNNDTVVPGEWLNRLVRHLHRKEIGLLNAVTNFSGNESRLEVPYEDLSGMEPFAREQGRTHDGEFFDIRVAAMYCVAMRSEVFERVGPLDEKFGIGMFEDDDYSHRVRIAGYRVVCAEDAFVHHWGQASFKKLSPEQYQRAWDQNQKWFEEKWKTRWRAHTPRKWRPENPALPDRTAVEIFFAKLAKAQELRDREKEHHLDVQHLKAEVAARDEHLGQLGTQLHEMFEKYEALVHSRAFRAIQFGWSIAKKIRPGRTPRRPALTAESFAPPTVEAAPEVAPPPAPVVASQTALAPVIRDDAYDVVCFPSIEWSFRFQRPQQMAVELGREGHRVFYVSHQFRQDGEPYEIRERAPGVHEISLRGPARDVFVQTLTPRDADYILHVLETMREGQKIGAAVTIAQLPFWAPVAMAAREKFGWPVVYDCMDLHSGFATYPRQMMEQELELIRRADLVAASSKALEAHVQDQSSNVLLLRNACDFDHFSGSARLAPPARDSRPLIGYYGAIAEWFDTELVASLARRHPEWDFVLVGSTVSADVAALRRLRNVSLAGERAYAEIPSWLARFDVAIIPFKVTPLTQATNPVKAYEILAGGKPVVSTALPEMMAMAPLVRIATGVEEFEKEIAQALEFDYEPEMVARRQAFARENTWQSRVRALDQRVRDLFPLVDLIGTLSAGDYPNARLVASPDPATAFRSGADVYVVSRSTEGFGRGEIARIVHTLRSAEEPVLSGDGLTAFAGDVIDRVGFPQGATMDEALRDLLARARSA
jgi:GT2 family glycosyltransferase